MSTARRPADPTQAHDAKITTNGNAGGNGNGNVDGNGNAGGNGGSGSTCKSDNGGGNGYTPGGGHGDGNPGTCTTSTDGGGSTTFKTDNGRGNDGTPGGGDATGNAGTCGVNGVGPHGAQLVPVLVDGVGNVIQVAAGGASSYALASAGRCSPGGITTTASSVWVLRPTCKPCS